MSEDDLDNDIMAHSPHGEVESLPNRAAYVIGHGKRRKMRVIKEGRWSYRWTPRLRALLRHGEKI